jgi:hypothetical protein
LKEDPNSKFAHIYWNELRKVNPSHPELSRMPVALAAEVGDVTIEKTELSSPKKALTTRDRSPPIRPLEEDDDTFGNSADVSSSQPQQVHRKTSSKTERRTAGSEARSTTTNANTNTTTSSDSKQLTTAQWLEAVRTRNAGNGGGGDDDDDVVVVSNGVEDEARQQTTKGRRRY